MGTRENIVLLRKHFGVTQEELAKIAGVTRGAVSQWEGGFSEPRMGAIQKMADHFAISKSNIIEDGGMKAVDPKTGKIVSVSPASSIGTIPGRRGCARHPRPVLGRVAAGEAREACPIPGETIDVDEEMWERCEDGAWVKVAGNSMNRLFPDGAMVYLDLCEHGATVSNGDVAAVFVNGDDITLKRVYFEDGALRLCPESYDPEYRDYVIDESDPDAPDVRFVGKAISFKADPKWRP